MKQLLARLTMRWNDFISAPGTIRRLLWKAHLTLLLLREGWELGSAWEYSEALRSSEESDCDMMWPSEAYHMDREYWETVV